MHVPEMSLPDGNTTVPNQSDTHASKKPRIEENVRQQQQQGSDPHKDNDDEETARKHLLVLMEQKQRIEEEIKNLEDVLESQRGVGLNGPLLDEEGYPRADIDLYAVRYARNRIIHLNNDHKTLMKEIETGLFNLHDKYKHHAANRTGDDDVIPHKAEPKPFLIVRTVTYRSPAFDAGLKAEDLIVNFGSLNVENFRTMLDVKGVCEQAHSANMPVLVKLMRKRQQPQNETDTTGDDNAVQQQQTNRDGSVTVHINLRPRTWSGAGLLGCYIEPLPREAVDK